MKKILYLTLLCSAVIFGSCKKEEKTGQDPEPGRSPVPEAPVIALEATDDAITVSWPAVEGAVGYDIQYCVASAAEYSQAGSTTGLSYTISNLMPETAYKVRVRTVADGAVSFWSNSSSAVTGFIVFTYPLTIKTAYAFTSWLANHASECSSSDIVKLGADLDLSGLNLAPASGFAGVFDGSGYAIKNLSSEKPLFLANTGTIKNLVLDSSCSFNVKAADYNIFGTIVQENSGSLEGCENHAAVAYSSTAEAFDKGILLGGIAGKSSGPVSSCKNFGDITLTAIGLSGTMLAGVVAHSSGNISECENRGKLTLDFSHTSSRIDYDYIPLSINYMTPGIGGIAGAVKGAKISKCNNYGEISYKDSAIEKQTGAKGRHQIGGIVSSPDGDVEDCVNEGAINICSWTSDRSAATDTNHEDLICVGGIAGGRFHSANQNNGDIRNCDNKGTITVDFDSAVSNTAVGGIMGWPGTEAQNPPSVVENCNNTGNIIISGAGKGRFAGLLGGTGRVRNSSSKADITINSANSASVAALGVGFHSQAHETTGLVLEGKLTANTAMAGLGGLYGNQGNVEENGATCDNYIDVTMVFGNGVTKYGLIIGLYNSGNKTVVTGTTAKPIKVRGSINGTAITSSNYTSYLCNGGAAENYKSVNAALWEK